jgi:hypothetical protein
MRGILPGLKPALILLILRHDSSRALAPLPSSIRANNWRQ